MTWRCKNLTAAFACAAILSVAAQAQVPLSGLRNVNRVVVKSEHVGEFMDIEKQLAAAVKKGGGAWRSVWRSYVGQANEFMIISPLDNYAARDGQPAYVKGMEPGPLAALMARRALCIESSRMTIERALSDVSFMTAGAAPPAMLRVTRTRVRPGMAEQYLALVKSDLAPALKKGGATAFRVRRVEWGGSRYDFTTSIPLEKMAELDGDSYLIKGMGQAGATQYTNKVGQLISYSEYWIYRYLPDQSIPPTQ
jgi:hypothetical protein